MKKLFLALVVLSAFSISIVAQSYTIQQYLNIRSALSPSLSPDGKRLAYLTNVTGTAQIWMMDLPSGAPKQITNYEDNVGFVRWSPAGNGLVFGKARGGNENTQLFWMSSDGSQIKELTGDPKVRHNFGGWSKDGKRVFYSSNERNPNYFDIYMLEFAKAGDADSIETLIYKQDGSNSVAAVSDDGRKLVISRSGTELSLDNNLYLLDVETNKATLLTPHTGASEFGDVDFLPGGDSIVLSANSDREFSTLAQISNLRAEAENKMFYVEKNAEWDTEGIEVSPRGDLLAYTVNREGFSELNLRKIETGGKPLVSNLNFKNEIVKLPARGVVSGLTFSGDGSKLAFTFSSAKNNTNVWLYDVSSKNLTQITKSDRAGIAQESFVEPQLIKYKSFDGREIPAWYYIPKNVRLVTSGRRSGGSGRYIFTSLSEVNKDLPEPTNDPTFAAAPKSFIFNIKKIPVIVSVHGGPEGQERPGFNPLYQYYLSRGYAVLATNVRGSTGYGKTFTHLDDVEKREDSVKDLAYAVEWLKTSGGADPKRIAVMGGSYGGYMTMAAITLYPELWAAAVNTVGIVNWETFLKNTSGYRRRQREVEYGMLDKDIEFLRRISPIAKVDKIKTPLFVIHGKNDPRVPYTEAEQIVKVLKERGGVVEYKLFDDEGHGISKLKNRLELYPLVADFLDKYMK
ncbi:MAG TPA: S9 family peptidase [Pyrinomonadaceae bacterium]|jgi:dipeptidyl aminopeptidase/acylaminoacyl peptidase